MMLGKSDVVNAFLTCDGFIRILTSSKVGQYSGFTGVDKLTMTVFSSSSRKPVQPWMS